MEPETYKYRDKTIRYFSDTDAISTHDFLNVLGKTYLQEIDPSQLILIDITTATTIARIHDEDFAERLEDLGLR